MARHNEIGKIGEKMATEYLIKKGYTIRDTNWRWLKYELDIVCEYQGRIVVVEVKTRTSDFVDPVEAVNRSKIIYLTKAVNIYVKMFNLPHEIQFDIITVTMINGVFQIEHIEDAFLPPLRTYR